MAGLGDKSRYVGPPESGTTNTEAMSFGALPPPPPYPTIVGGMYPTLTPQNQMPYPEMENQPMAYPTLNSRPLFNVIPMGPPSKEAEPPQFRHARLMLGISKFMLIPAIIIFGAGIAVTVMAYRDPHVANLCTRPSSRIWIGALGILSAFSGIKAARNISLASARRTTVSFFVLTICMAICDGSLLMLTSQCVVRGSHDLRVMNEMTHVDPFISFGHGPKLLIALVVLEGATAIAALLHMISSIIASSLICGRWCNQQSSPVTVIYIHPETISNVRRLAAVAPCHENQQVYFVATQMDQMTPPKYEQGQPTFGNSGCRGN